MVLICEPSLDVVNARSGFARPRRFRPFFTREPAAADPQHPINTSEWRPRRTRSRARSRSAVLPAGRRPRSSSSRRCPSRPSLALTSASLSLRSLSSTRYAPSELVDPWKRCTPDPVRSCRRDSPTASPTTTARGRLRVRSRSTARRRYEPRRGGSEARDAYQVLHGTVLGRPRSRTARSQQREHDPRVPQPFGQDVRLRGPGHVRAAD